MLPAPGRTRLVVAASASLLVVGAAPTAPSVASPPVVGAVLLPTGYARSSRRYPVLYLLHGGTDGVNHFLANTDLRKATKALPRKQQYIVVTPYGGYAGFYRDWVDGSHRFQSKHIERVIPTIDRTGVPCNREDANDPTAAAIEQIAHRGTQSMDRALTAAGIPHTYRTAPCGVHTTPYFNTQVVRYVRTIGRVFASRLTGGAAPADRTAR